VGPGGPAGAGDLGQLRARPLLVDLGDLDPGPVLGEEPGDGAADAVAAPGDDGDLAVEQAVPIGDRRDVGRLRIGHADGLLGRRARTRAVEHTTPPAARSAATRKPGRPAAPPG
jgi:hypothetical protein